LSVIGVFFLDLLSHLLVDSEPSEHVCLTAMSEVRELDLEWILTFERKAHGEFLRALLHGGFIIDQVQTVSLNQESQFKADFVSEIVLGRVADDAYSSVFELPPQRPAIQPTLQGKRERTGLPRGD
jgi:hypothetical protein